MGRVSGKVAIVTGAARGLGAADARLLAKEGASVILTDISPGVMETAAGIEGAIGVVQDVSSPEGWAEVIALAETRFGRLDVLVNNAGIVDFTTIEESTLENFRRVYAISAEGTFLGCQAAIPLMRKSGGGSIINMSSVAALNAYPIVCSYAAAKGAVRSMSRNIAVYCQEQGYNIRVNAILPGIIASDMTAAAAEEVKRRGLEVPAADPAKAPKVGQPEDIANLVLYLASDESRMVNAAELVIDDAVTAK
ncbi:SDR family oxidoreductase [Acidocella sp.]|uniref:SDR family oxidoreductase n=1 Tax=Acidocella sp. TaxID=50710 RepID=UPI0018577BC7|nr:SDR family oxidoreductase [Acidocella sp.]NNM58142.1 SDR family oxidoreductase [Acidocella sp.]